MLHHVVCLWFGYAKLRSHPLIARELNFRKKQKKPVDTRIKSYMLDFLNERRVIVALQLQNVQYSGYKNATSAFLFIFLFHNRFNWRLKCQHIMYILYVDIQTSAKTVVYICTLKEYHKFPALCIILPFYTSMMTIKISFEPEIRRTI